MQKKSYRLFGPGSGSYRIKGPSFFASRNRPGLVALFVAVFFLLTVAAGFRQVHDVYAGDGPQSVSDRISADAFLASDASDAFQRGEFQTALEALDRLLGQFPGDPLLRRYRAMTLDRLGRSEEAIAIFKDLLTEEPTHLPTRFFLGQAYERSGNREEAISTWQVIAREGEGTPYELWGREALDRVGAAVETGPARIARWQVVGRYGWEYDTNVVLKPDDKSLATPLDQNAGRHTLDLTIRYRALAGRDLAVDLFYATRQTLHDDGLDDFNFHSEEIGALVRKRVQVGQRDVLFGMRYDLLLGFLDGNTFSTRNRWHFSADTRFTPRTRTVLFDRLTVSNFGPDGFDPSRTSRDGLDNDVGIVHYIYSSDFQRFLFFRQEIASQFSRGDNFDTFGTRTRIGLHTPVWKDKLDFDASAGMSFRNFHNFSSISTRDESRRRDVVWDLYNSLTYHVTPRLGLRFFYRYIDGWNQNNFFDYRRHISGAQLIYSQVF